MFQQGKYHHPCLVNGSHSIAQLSSSVKVTLENCASDKHYNRVPGSSFGTTTPEPFSLGESLHHQIWQGTKHPWAAAKGLNFSLTH